MKTRRGAFVTATLLCGERNDLIDLALGNCSQFSELIDQA
jgi:hypothetical protein